MDQRDVAKDGRSAEGGKRFFNLQTKTEASSAANDGFEKLLEKHNLAL